ncbi:MAG: GNAT family N-acetyltransferase [Clostridium sp.]|uniref:GNAT family N-acetyltransferase n=1 Tax=Clostridium sp. TaxID=1506 RepID=UPI002906A83D|nr:GNAT family N-acetyltransferase [Clostridium sp.]MDU4938097.1 GNAT family N-acetyltransferase [Clostridium sp.]
MCMASIKEVSNQPVLKDRRVGHLDVLCVDEMYRKRGIGKKLCDEIIFRLREKGVVSLELMVWSFNKEAINFYESIGMVERNKVMEYKL